MSNFRQLAVEWWNSLQPNEQRRVYADWKIITNNFSVSYWTFETATYYIQEAWENEEMPEPN